MRTLLRFFGCSAGLATNIAADIRGISSLTHDILERGPSLASSRWRALVGELHIDACRELADGLLDKAALGNAGAEENGVDEQQDPGAFLEEQRGANDAEPEGNLEHGNEGHGPIIVLFDESANGLGGAGRSRLGAGGGGGWGLDGGQQVGAHVGSHVEDGIDGKR